MSSSSPLWVGIDVSSKRLDIALGSLGETSRIDNSDHGISSLISRLLQLPIAGIICEATGFYHQALTLALWEVNLPLTIVNPAWIKAFRGTTGKRAKTDRADARLLASYGEYTQPAPSRVIPKVERDLRELVSARDDLVTQRVAIKHRLRSTTVPQIRAALERAIDFFTSEITRLDDEITATIDSSVDLAERRRIIRSMPGLGPVHSAIMVAFLPELGALNRREIASLGGLAPFARDSGTLQGKRFVQFGRAPIRKAMYLAARMCGTKDLALNSRKDRLRAKGKLAKVVNIALARWMLTMLNVMVRDGLLWQDLDQAHRIVEVPTT